MKKAYKLDFQKIRRKTQIKDFMSFELYLKNIFSDIAKREWTEKDQKGLDKISFIEYMNIPFIVGEKLFNSFDKNKKGYLTQIEFVNGIISLYVGDLEETQKTVFNILDFDNDGIIIPEDSRLLISFIKNLSKPPINVIKQKLLSRNTITDEENLNEINELINNFFNNKTQMTFEEYKYNIENINSDVFFVFIYFLYNNKPFGDSSIKILKLLSKSNNLTSSFSSSVMNSSSEDCTADSTKSKVKSPSNTFKSFIYDLVDVDIEEIERECVEGENEAELSENNEEYNNLLNEELIEIKIPQFSSKLDIKEKKSDKDYPSPNNTQIKNCNFNWDFDNNNIKNNNMTRGKIGNKSYNNLNNIINNNLNNEFNNVTINNNNFNFVKVNNNPIPNKALSNKTIFGTKKSLSKEFLEGNINNGNEIIKNSINNDDMNGNINFANTPISTLDRSDNKNIFNITINNNSNELNNFNKFAVGNKKEFKNENCEIKMVNASQNKKNLNNKLENTYLNDNNSLLNSKNNYNTNSININNNNLTKKNINSSNNLNLESSRNSTLRGQSVDELITVSDIIYENYIFKSRSNNKLKKYYLVLIGMDLFYFSNSKKTKLKGMHNLSGSYINEEGDLIKVREEVKTTNKNIATAETTTVNYYPFKLYFKKKSRVYYCARQEECQNWIKHIREITKFRNINDYYDFGESLGKGKFGNVKLGINKENNTKSAIKTINKSILKGIETEMVKTEIEIMRFCRHQNIVKLIDNFEDLENIYIVLEFLTGGNLNSFLSQQQTILPEKKIKEIIYQIGTGIKYLHHFGILHRDLKPENLMMSDKNHKIAIVKIVDFGLSKILGVTERSNDAYGTLSYAAPEVIQKNLYNNTIDIWSLGVILFFLVCGYLPFNDKNNNVSKIANDIAKANVKFDMSIWNSFSPWAKDLTIKCLEKDLNKRINIKDFLEHDWFKNN